MTDRLSLIAGAVFGLTGLIMLARLDLGTIERGGLAGTLAGLDLGIATLLVSILLGLVTRHW